MGCGNSKRVEPKDERRIRITESNPSSVPISPDDTVPAFAVPSAPRSTIITARSTQDSRMAEQEQFVRSLPVEARHILNATMANMLDLGQGSASPADWDEREQLYQSIREEVPMPKPAISELPTPSNKAIRQLTPEEAEFMKTTTDQLCFAFRSIQIHSTTSIVQPFLPIPH